MPNAPPPPLLNMHEDIINRLNHFIKIKKIPNIIFHGSSGCGKNTILSDFLSNIYQKNQSIMKNYIMTVNCAHGRGIRFIRDELKFFAKTNVDLLDGERFKSIVLLNADKLTIDAQSALRRCIELFCHSTRFFIVVDDKNKLLKPILSRFCDIFISNTNTEPAFNSESLITRRVINLHQYNLEKTVGLNAIKQTRRLKLKAVLLHNNENDTAAVLDGPGYFKFVKMAEDLYEMGYSALDLIEYVELETTDTVIDDTDIDIADATLKKYELLIAFSRVKKEIRNEKLLMLFVLYFMKFRSELELKNITFI
jgi:DNA polymerase III delta prime subunit